MFPEQLAGNFPASRFHFGFCPSGLKHRRSFSKHAAWTSPPHLFTRFHEGSWSLGTRDRHARWARASWLGASALMCVLVKMKRQDDGAGWIGALCSRATVSVRDQVCTSHSTSSSVFQLVFIYLFFLIAFPLIVLLLLKWRRRWKKQKQTAFISCPFT